MTIALLKILISRDEIEVEKILKINGLNTFNSKTTSEMKININPPF